MNSIIPVLLAGGSGKRLWPLSRKSYPKQFSKIIGNKSLFQQSALRLTTSESIKFEPHITLTNSDFRFIASRQLLDLGILPGPIIIEPESKNTAPAILAASLFAFKKNKEAILIVAPSDHVIDDTQKFHDAINKGLNEVLRGKIITFGIKPTEPKIGYGYIELEKVDFSKPSDIVSFVEKPKTKIAQEMLKKGNYLWNSGIFLFRAKDMIDAFTNFAPTLLSTTKDAFENAMLDLGFLRLNPKAWSLCENTSIDYAIMEKLQNLSVVPFSGLWTDLGDWNEIWKEMEPDENGVSLSLNAHSHNCSNTLLRSENDHQIIFGLGLKDIVAVAMPDAVLIANKEMTQDVEKVVRILESQNISQAKISPKDYRPWGWFEIISTSKKTQVKRIYVNPGAALSLQSHKYRSEHWVVVEGTAKVIINEEEKLLKEGQSVYVPLGAVHRMENQGKQPMILIEVQIGEYLGEDDIIRYEDLYSRDKEN